MASNDREGEARLVGGVIAREPDAVAEFARLATQPIWTAVAVIDGEGAHGESSFERILIAIRANNFLLLRRFDGRAPLSTFLKLLAREILVDEIAAALASAPAQTWPRFERAFGRQIRRRIASRFPRDSDRHGDLYQDVCLLLIDADYRRLRVFDGRGRLEGYVARLVENLLVDLMRRETPRRRLPAAVDALPPLEQTVFKAVAWQGAEADAKRLCAALTHRFEGLDVDATTQALEAVRGAIETARSARATGRVVALEQVVQEGVQLADGANNPEQALLAREAEGRHAQFREEMESEAARMPADERALLSLMLAGPDPVAPREVARRLGKPIQEVRLVHARVLRRLKKLPSVRKLAALSVSDEDEGEDA